MDRLAHAIYGLIVLTATVGELRLHEDDAATALALVAAGAAVLVVAHTYSQLVAASAMNRSIPPRSELVATIVDQLALGVPAALAVAVLGLAGVEVLSLDTAYDIVLAGSLAALFALGLVIGLHHHRSLTWALGLGFANLALGAAIVGIEIAAAH